MTDELTPLPATLSRARLLSGAANLLGDWVPEASADGARRARGIAFPTVEERDAHDPGHRPGG